MCGYQGWFNCPDVSMVIFPIAPFLVGSDIAPVRDSFDRFIDGLIKWQPRATETGPRQPPKLRVEANGYEAALDKMNRQFLMNAWGDGLPLFAPNEERVDWILKGTEQPREQVIGKVMPRGGILTVEAAAVSLAMAGGRPEYLPVLTAAMSAIVEPGMEHDKWQATSGSTFPVVIVNGPIARQIRLNSSFGLLGPDPQHPAGASIGRAIRTPTAVTTWSHTIVPGSERRNANKLRATATGARVLTRGLRGDRTVRQPNCESNARSPSWAWASTTASDGSRCASSRIAVWMPPVLGG